MNKFWFFILTTLNVMLFSSLSFGETIRFATEATYPPFEYMDQRGTLQGFDIEIAQALCHQMQAQCSFTNQAFNSLLPSLQLGKFDALIAAMSITPARKDQVAFTQSYYEPSASFVIAKTNHDLEFTLDGKIVGVQAGTTFEKYLDDHFIGKIQTKSYASIQDAFLDLRSARIDAVFADTPIAQTWLNQGDHTKQFALLDSPIIDHNYFGAGYGIAVSKQNNALLQKLNSALTAIKKDGTYNKIAKKYFGKYLLKTNKTFS